MPAEALIKFIIRYEIPDFKLSSPPGKICIGRANILDEPGDSKRPVQVYNPDDRTVGVWVPRDSLLPRTEFLKHQSSRADCWVIAQTRFFFIDRKVNPFVSKPKNSPKRGLYGHEPWRFESLGEALYYAETRRLHKQQFSVVKINSLQSFDA